jgi:propane monooxygenase reductase subunit
MAPVLSLLRQLAADGKGRTVRFFYGARGRPDLFYSELIQTLGRSIEDFEFVQVLSAEEPGGSAGDDVRYGYVHDAVDEWLNASSFSMDACDVYMAGPPPMIDAVSDILSLRHAVEQARVFVDRFTFTGPEEDSESEAGAVISAVPQRGDVHDERSQ